MFNVVWFCLSVHPIAQSRQSFVADYLQVVKALYFDAPATDLPVTLALDTQVVLSANGLLLVALGLYPTALMTWCANAF